MEVVALASNAAAEVERDGLAEDEFIMGLGVGDAEDGVPLMEMGTDSAFGMDSTLASPFSLPFKALDLKLEILDMSSVCVPLTAFETVSNVLLTRDMC